MRRITAVAVVVGLLLSVTGCTKTVYVTTTEAPNTEAPVELRSGFTVNGYKIEPAADLTDAYLRDEDLSFADLTAVNLSDADLSYANLTLGTNVTDSIVTGATMPDGSIFD